MKPSLGKMLFMGIGGAFWLAPLWVYLAVFLLGQMPAQLPSNISPQWASAILWLVFSLAVCLTLSPGLAIFGRLSDLLKSILIMLFPVVCCDWIIAIFATPSALFKAEKLSLDMLLALGVFVVIAHLFYRRRETVVHRQLSSGCHRVSLNGSVSPHRNSMYKSQPCHYNWSHCRSTHYQSSKSLRQRLILLLSIVFIVEIIELASFVNMPSTALLSSQSLSILGLMYLLSFLPLTALVISGVWQGYAWAIVGLMPMTLVSVLIVILATERPLLVRVCYLLLCLATLLWDMQLFRQLYRVRRGAITAR